MKKNKKLLQLYEECMVTGELPEIGLCDSVECMGVQRKLKLISPTVGDLDQLIIEGKSIGFWGYEVPYNSGRYSTDGRSYVFTPLRQTLLLLMAALNDEL